MRVVIDPDWVAVEIARRKSYGDALFELAQQRLKLVHDAVFPRRAIDQVLYGTAALPQSNPMCDFRLVKADMGDLPEGALSAIVGPPTEPDGSFYVVVVK